MMEQESLHENKACSRTMHFLAGLIFIVLSTINVLSAEIKDVHTKYDKTFYISSLNNSSINTLTIKVANAQGTMYILQEDIEGTIVSTGVADLNSDGLAEIYIFTNSAGSGSYGNIRAYNIGSANLFTKIHFESYEKDSERFSGYMGHDVFLVDENYIKRTFPKYKEGSTNVEPSEIFKELRYKLVLEHKVYYLKPVN